MAPHFKPIPGYPDYAVSRCGNVFSFKYGKHRQLKPSDNGGYRQVVLYKNKKAKTIKVHRLVAMTWIDLIPSDKVVNHINGIKHDNRVENLEIVSVQENLQHALETGLHAVGEKHTSCKLTDQQVREIRRKGKTMTQTTLGREYGVSARFIGQILSGERRSRIND